MRLGRRCCWRRRRWRGGRWCGCWGGWGSGFLRPCRWQEQSDGVGDYADCERCLAEPFSVGFDLHRLVLVRCCGHRDCLKGLYEPAVGNGKPSACEPGQQSQTNRRLQNGDLQVRFVQRTAHRLGSEEAAEVAAPNRHEACCTTLDDFSRVESDLHGAIGKLHMQKKAQGAYEVCQSTERKLECVHGRSHEFAVGSGASHHEEVSLTRAVLCRVFEQAERECTWVIVELGNGSRYGIEWETEVSREHVAGAQRNQPERHPGAKDCALQGFMNGAVTTAGEEYVCSACTGINGLLASTAKCASGNDVHDEAMAAEGFRNAFDDARAMLQAPAGGWVVEEDGSAHGSFYDAALGVVREFLLGFAVSVWCASAGRCALG